jgi:hypothetical protein
LDGQAGEKDQRRYKNDATDPDASDQQAGKRAKERDPDERRYRHRRRPVLCPNIIANPTE